MLTRFLAFSSSVINTQNNSASTATAFVTSADIGESPRVVLGEDDGVAVGLDTGQEQEALSCPALVQSHVGPQLVLPSSAAAAGVQSQVASRERDLATVEMVD